MDTPGSPPRTLTLGALFPLLVVSALGGCLGEIYSPDSCTTVDIPSLDSDSETEFDFEGPRILRPSTDYILGTWPGETPNRSGGPLRFQEETTVEVDVADRPEAHVSLSGEERSAWQVTYTAREPNRTTAYPFLDIWIDAETGNPIEITGRGVDRDPDAGVRHSRWWGGWGRPQLLVSSLFWGEELEEGDAGTLTYPRGLYFPQLDSQAEEGVVEWTVDAVTAGENCRARLSVDLSPPPSVGDGLDQSITIVFEDGVPLPVRYEARLADPSVDPFEARLLEHDPGDGEPLPAFQEAPVPAGRLPTAPSQEGFLAGGEDVFPLSYEEALEALRDGEETGPWLRDHPEARPQKVIHEPGAPDDRVVDGWEMRWVASDGESRWLTATQRERLVPMGSETETETAMREAKERPRPPEEASWVTLDALAELHRRIYDAPLRALDCEFAAPEDPSGPGPCLLGPVEHTDHAYHDPGGARVGGIWGTVVWPERGIVAVEQSYSPEAVPAPTR